MPTEYPAEFWYSATLSEYECPKQIHYHLTKEERVVGDALLEGTELHKQAELFLKGELKREQTYLPEDFFEFVKSFGNSAWRTEGELTWVEDRWRCKGIIDAITSCGTLVDWKFPQKRWYPQKAQKYIRSQGIIYPYLARKHGILVERACFFVMPTNGEPAECVEIPFTQESLDRDIMQHKARYRSILNQVENNGLFANPSKFTCRFCHWKNACEDRIN